MTVLATEPNKVTAPGNGVATVFSFSPMIIYENTDLQVTFVSTTGAETVLAEGIGVANYSLQVSSFPGTGTITYPADASGTKLQTNEKLVIKPVLLFEQETDLQNQGGYFPDVQETMHDRAVKLSKQLQEIIERCIKLPVAEVGGSLAILPSTTDRANKLLGFGALPNANPIATSSGVTGTLVTAFGATLVDDATSGEARITLDASKRNWITDNLVIQAFANGSNALDIQILNQLHANPSAANPLLFQFADASITTEGNITQINHTSSLALLISAGSSLGTISGVKARIYIGVADDAGTARLFVYNATDPLTNAFLGLQEDVRYSSTAEGGAGGADLAQTLYSGTAFSNKHIRLLGYLEVTEAIAGTWASDPSKIILLSNLAVPQLPPTLPRPEGLVGNPVINGNMEVWQRSTSFVGVPANFVTADRYRWNNSGGVGVVTISRSTNVPTVAQADVLFNFSLDIDVTTGDSVSAGTFYTLVHKIAGHNWRHFAQRQFTLSFWVRDTVTGPHAVSFINSGADRSFVGTYNIDVADTWEYKTITVSGSPSAGTWDYTTGIGLAIHFTLSAGSTFQTTAGAWQTGNFYGTSATMNSMSSSSNFFRITGITMNVGPVAYKTGFRTFHEELALCKAYYQKSFAYGTTPVTNAGVNTGELQSIAGKAGALAQLLTQRIAPPMISAPSFSVYNPGAANSQVRDETAAADCSATSGIAFTAESIKITATGNAATAVGNTLGAHWTADAEI